MDQVWFRSQRNLNGLGMAHVLKEPKWTLCGPDSKGTLIDSVWFRSQRNLNGLGMVQVSKEPKWTLCGPGPKVTLINSVRSRSHRNPNELGEVQVPKKPKWALYGLRLKGTCVLHVSENPKSTFLDSGCYITSIDPKMDLKGFCKKGHRLSAKNINFTGV